MGWIRDLVERRKTKLQKAASAGAPAAPVESTPAPKAWAFDPQQMAFVYASDVPTETHPGTLGLPYSTLLAMSRVPIFATIIQTRVNQMAEFFVPRSSPYSVGFWVRQRDRQAKPTPASRRRAAEIEAMLLSAGGRHGYGGLEPSVRALMRDAFIYDQANFEVLRTRGGKPCGFVPVDAATIRRARPSRAALEAGRWDPEQAAYVQVVNQRIVNEYGHEEMAWGIRRPRTWLYASGYGYPELEELVRVTTNLLNADTYNATNFTNGIHASTILAVKSAMDRPMFESFRRNLQAMMTGPRNAKKTPVVQLDPSTDAKEEIQAINLSSTNKDMEFASWQNYLIKMGHAVFQMDAAENGWVYGNEGQSGSTLNQRGPSERIDASKARGLRPAIRSAQGWFNEWLVYPYDPDFMLELSGYDSITEADKLELDAKSLKTFKTVDEVRAEHELSPIGGAAGNMILDPVFAQAYLKQDAEDAAGDDDPFGGYQGTDIDEMTMSLGAGVEQRIKDGRLLVKGRGPRGRWVPVRSGPGVRSFVVEVD